MKHGYTKNMTSWNLEKPYNWRENNWVQLNIIIINNKQKIKTEPEQKYSTTGQIFIRNLKQKIRGINWIELTIYDDHMMKVSLFFLGDYIYD